MTRFKYLGATLCKDGTCSAEVCIRIALAMARLNTMWRCNTISFANKFKLYKSLVTSILHSCKTWTLLADSEKKDPGFRNQVLEETSPYLLLRAQDQRLRAEQDQLLCGSTGTSSGNCQETETRKQVQALQAPDMSHVTTASPEPSFMEPWRLGDAAVGRGNAGWTASKTRHPCPFQKRSQGPAAEKKRLEEDLY